MLVASSYVILWVTRILVTSHQKMILRALRAFLAFQRLGTIAAAAQEVNLSSAAISSQFKLLEEQLGATLFVRTKRSLILSSAGVRLVPLAEKMLADYEEMLLLSNTESLQGRISIGVVNSVLTGIFPAVLLRLKTDHPRLQIKIEIGNSQSLVSKVEAGLLDAAVVNKPPGPLDESFSVHHLYTDPVALIQPASMQYSSFSDALSNEPYLALDRNTWVGRAIDQFLVRNDVVTQPAWELDSQIAVLSAVRFGLGVTVLPLICGTRLDQDPSLHVVPLNGITRVVTLIERSVHPFAHLTAELIRAVVDIAGQQDQ
ncbi:LysR substrate-binding domain-containing protein [Paraburkholderia sp. JHI869]|uniref:LysR substrate-binding domain-containing protein n=1 Tax=Paraburkholderia sp. JHI869 TaxID=3112959 RepID=UPI0031777865